MHFFCLWVTICPWWFDQFGCSSLQFRVGFGIWFGLFWLCLFFNLSWFGFTWFWLFSELNIMLTIGLFVLLVTQVLTIWLFGESSAYNLVV
ncbi:hypothetical protein MtrunA17_Chr4g0032121 [Medicago truncatula]|uniref:Transmembrane protein n=1 Tax=Medicago truncatula TaxID=3880 RepID=A0A396I8G6_MEDTR|nr:hypothetical protein MtrunA17_Chr4g0032121 [Medicago truncatula]